MSETHPSAPTLKKGRNRQRLSKLIDCWPLIIWLAVLAVAVVGYSRGIVFTRMNGVVDVYQESIAPTEDGTFLKLADGIETGKHVKGGQVIAYMDTAMIELEIERFKERRKLRGQGDVDRSLRQLVGLKEDQWDANRKLSETNAELEMLDLQLKAIGSRPELQQRKGEIEFKVKMLTVEKAYRTDRRDGLKEAVAQRQALLDKLQDGSQTEIPMDAEDQKQLAMLELVKTRTILKVRRDGTVDRILKEENEFVEAGESIVKVVAQPTQILGFVPQQEVSTLKKGDDVWVTSSVDRYTTFKSQIIDLSPRIDNVRDAASPLPNQAVRGRTVLIEYPVESGFLPGQTVIIHLQPPGEISFMRKIFELF